MGSVDEDSSINYQTGNLFKKTKKASAQWRVRVGAVHLGPKEDRHPRGTAGLQGPGGSCWSRHDMPFLPPSPHRQTK